jgi:hypothetical protein
MTTPCIVARLEAKSDNSYVGSMRISAAKLRPLGGSYRRTFSLAMAALLTVAIGFNPATRAQDASPEANSTGWK